MTSKKIQKKVKEDDMSKEWDIFAGRWFQMTKDVKESEVMGIQIKLMIYIWKMLVYIPCFLYGQYLLRLWFKYRKWSIRFLIN